MAEGQQHARSGRSSDRTEDELDGGDATATGPAASERDTSLDDDVDSILDEIDDVLEENAEEFVRGFVQKGGQ